MNLEFIKPQNLGSLLMKLSQSNFDLRLPSSYLARSYLIATVPIDLRPENSTAKVTLCLYIEHKLRGKRGERFVFRHLLLCKAFETNTGRSVSAWI